MAYQHKNKMITGVQGSKKIHGFQHRITQEKAKVALGLISSWESVYWNILSIDRFSLNA